MGQAKAECRILSLRPHVAPTGVETFFDGSASALRLISIRDAKSRCPTMKTE